MCQVTDDVMARLRRYLQRVLSQLLESEMKAVYGSLWYRGFSLCILSVSCGIDSY